MAKLYFRYGAMSSSKTAQAIMVKYNYGERGQKALLVKRLLIFATVHASCVPAAG